MNALHSKSQTELSVTFDAHYLQVFWKTSNESLSLNTVLITVYCLFFLFAKAMWLIYVDDILNVRLQTLGVTEHSFPVHMAGKKYHWKLYDVGGAVSDLHSTLMDISFFTSFSVDRCGYTYSPRCPISEISYQRPAWVPYFDDGKCPNAAHSVF